MFLVANLRVTSLVIPTSVEKYGAIRGLNKKYEPVENVKVAVLEAVTFFSNRIGADLHMFFFLYTCTRFGLIW